MSLKRTMRDSALMKLVNGMGSTKRKWSSPKAREILNLIETLHPRIPPAGLIRMGADGDGGYLVPDLLDGCKSCFSPGVCDVSDFELDCAERGMRVFLADASVEAPPKLHPSFSFRKQYLSASSHGEFMTMQDWVSQSVPADESHLILQMDIEGGEYETILSMSDALLSRFRIIVIEFHDLHHMFDKFAFGTIFRPTFEKLLQNHFCVHAHPNNNRQLQAHRSVKIPPLLEMTFLHRQFADGAVAATEFPHPLDQDNDLPASVGLPRSWYSFGSTPDTDGSTLLAKAS